VGKQRNRSKKRKANSGSKPQPASPSPVATTTPGSRVLRGGVLLGLGAILASLLIAVGMGCFKSKEDESSNLAVCRKFMRLKNAGDPAANDLLAGKPDVPEEPVSPEEAEQLDAAFMLRDDFTIAEVRRADGDADGSRFVLVIKGGVGSERFSVQTLDGPESRYRAIGNPDILVEVKDGRIHGLKAQIHHDPNEKPASPETERELLEMYREGQKQLIEKYRGKSK
jgi:hypothetical protein